MLDTRNDFLQFGSRENRILSFIENNLVIPEYLSITCASFDSYSTRETRFIAMCNPRLLLDSSRENPTVNLIGKTKCDRTFLYRFAHYRIHFQSSDVFHIWLITLNISLENLYIYVRPILIRFNLIHLSID